MKSRFWRLAVVSVLSVGVSAQLLADERGEGNPQQGRPGGGEHRPQGQGGQTPLRPEHNQQAGGHGQPQGGQWQSRPQGENPQVRPSPPGNHLSIQPRPDAVQQTQPPRQGHYQDIPRRPGDYSQWQGHSRPNNGPNPGFNNGRPIDHPWQGRPDGHGNGWGAGPQYRPGYIVDRFPDRHWQVPYRGQDYFYSGGYWYRPHGPRYVVVQPPYGIRVGYLPDYAREVWIGSSLLFLAAGAYYAYQPATQDYIVVPPPAPVPVAAPQPVSNGYDVVAYPANGQTPAQVDQDRYDCYRWAVDQSGFDPARVTYAPSPAVVQTYRQAQGNCLSSRGYQVTY
ncbi:glycine zipper family protein [Pseudomonas lundensis]|uniref:Glycine zipper family protein n=1 Tax=Pseudomonas lundensis TaxID=86185 RepID=A0A266NGA7_9PSED|nr:DUF6515 family protein [Pseudomonas lundensis]OZY60947.1 glycine zipper family protein [Pseudomonas lundensis]